MHYQLEIQFEEANLTLSFDNEPNAKLSINNLVRETVNSEQQLITLKLNSVVQTGYEYHESIEAIIIYGESDIQACIRASDTELIQKTVKRQ